jgi:hypothetical protein
MISNKKEYIVDDSATPQTDDKYSDLIQFHNHFSTLFNETERSTDFPERFYQSFLNGENIIYQKEIVERRAFLENWIEKVEKNFIYLENITVNPYSKNKPRFQTTEIANKILEINRDELQTYENFFVKTLIDRLYFFIRSRYSVIKENIDVIERRQFNIKSKFTMRETVVNLELDLVFKKALYDDDLYKKNQILLKRIDLLSRRAQALKDCAFMEYLKNCETVLSPINVTKILSDEKDYKNSYQLWLLLDQYTELNYDLDIQETNLTFDRLYLKQVYQSVLYLFSVVTSNQKNWDFTNKAVDLSKFRRITPQQNKKRLDEDEQEEFRMEDSRINEYYLEQSKKMFEEVLDKYTETSANFDIALRKALMDTTAISNAIYSLLFGFYQVNDNYLDNCFTKQDFEMKLSDIKTKQKRITTIREVKDVDYKDAIRLEKKQLNEIVDINKNFIVQLKKNKTMDEAKKHKKIETANLEIDEMKRYIDFLNNHVLDVDKYRGEINQVNNDNKISIKEHKDALVIFKRDLLEGAKTKAQQEYQTEQAKIKYQANKDYELVLNELRNYKDNFKTLIETTNISNANKLNKKLLKEMNKLLK